MFSKKNFYLVLLMTLVLGKLVISDISIAQAEISLSSGFDHLLEITTDKTKKLDSVKIEKILAFVCSKDFQTTPEYSGEIMNAESAYYGYNIKCTMEQMLRICQNPKIPAHVVLPEAIRLSEWNNNEFKPPVDTPDLWKELNTLKDNIIVKGSLYMQSTPDISTGAYYGYDSFQSNILLKYKGRNVYISVAKQKDISEVGKKGFVVGNYNDLNYFYSGKPGLNVFGLGGIESYLYDGFSIAVYIESESGKNNIQCGTFKWLKGGWAGLNIVRTKDIYNGLKRFADTQKTLFESGKFPDYNELLTICSKYRLLSKKQMKKMMGTYFYKLQQVCNADKNCPEILKDGFNPDEYIDKMSKDEMRSALIVENIKRLLNKKNHKNELKISFNN